MSKPIRGLQVVTLLFFPGGGCGRCYKEQNSTAKPLTQHGGHGHMKFNHCTKLLLLFSCSPGSPAENIHSCTHLVPKFYKKDKELLLIQHKLNPEKSADNFKPLWGPQ